MIVQRRIGRVAVTGAAGFIGSHLVERLANLGADVVAVVRPNSSNGIGNLASLSPAIQQQIEIRYVDILDPRDLRIALEGADTIFHLAAQINVPYSLKAPLLFMQTNSIGSLNIMDVALTLDIQRVVIVSSSEVYGGVSHEAVNEVHPLCAKSPYAASKIAAEKLAESYFYSYGLGTVVIRPFNTYGPRQSERAVIPRIINQALANGEVALGNLDPIRDFVFVEDTVEGFIASATVEGIDGQTFNLATGHGISIREVISCVSEVLERPLRVAENQEYKRSASSEVWTLIGDATKARSHLNWVPKTDFKEGIRRVIESSTHQPG